MNVKVQRIKRRHDRSGGRVNPFQFANADKVIYRKNPGISRHEALESYIDYAEYHMSENDGKLSRQCLQRLLKPCMNLFARTRGNCSDAESTKV